MSNKENIDHRHGNAANNPDFRETMNWRIFRIMAEVIEGFQGIADFKTSVSIFGSSRSTPDDHYYKEAQKLGNMLAEKGITVVTGGGPGIMEAGNRGALEGGGDSVGLKIELPKSVDQETPNKYANTTINFHYFFTRKLMLTYAAEAYVYFPGGFGTLDEFFEIVTLIKTDKICSHILVVLVGVEYWQPLINWFKSELHDEHAYIDDKALNIFKLVDTAEEALELILKEVKPRKEI